MEDSLWAGLTDSHAGMPMGMTAENLADKVIHQYYERFTSFLLTPRQKTGPPLEMAPTPILPPRAEINVQHKILRTLNQRT